MMRHEFQRQRLRRRPGQGGSGRRQRPGLEIGEIGGERPQAVLAHSLLGEMFEGRDVLVGQNLGEAIAAVHRQDRRQGVELEGAPRHRIAGQGRGGGFTHPAALSRRWTKTGFASLRAYAGKGPPRPSPNPARNRDEANGRPSADAGLGCLRRFPWPLCRPSAGLSRAPDSGGADELKDFQAPRESPFWNALPARPFSAARGAQAAPITLARCSARILIKTEAPAKRPDRPCPSRALCYIPI